jgi:acyl-CoA synthetase (AMP-forming)/AMP-acid ligase II
VVSLGPESVVLDEDNKILDMQSSVGAVGRLARSGSVPLGYYKDPEKSARTFIEIDGTRYSVPGDFARIEADNKVTLLGRGSNCINTGGEKVYPEEVEMALKAHPDVYDVLVVGVTDENYGQAVSAVIQARDGKEPPLEELRTFLRPMLSGYKLPRSVTYVPEIPRSATGKANYPKARELATRAKGTPAGV